MTTFPYIERSFTAQVDGSRQTYLLLMPPQIETAETLVVCFHGHGSHQEQFLTPVIYDDRLGELVRFSQARNLLYAALEYRGNSWMGPLAEADTRQVIAELREEFQPKRVVLVGGSMGGTSVLIYAALHPEGIDGVVSLCPATDTEAFYHEALTGPLPELSHAIQASYGGTPEEVPEEYHRRSSRRHADRLTMPLMISHGDADALIPVSHSRALVKRLTDIGAPVQYTEIPGGDHDAPIAVLTQEVAGLLGRFVRK
ncbi:MAG: alpha/beta hydrolase family protein [Armatimonadota bacterium]